jgi:glycosyltransferase involved in cell wall biosynthesis
MMASCGASTYSLPVAGLIHTPDGAWLRDTSVVIPALNEASCIAQTAAAWRALGLGGICVVDNGSQDDTGRVAREAGAGVVVEARRGYGAAAWRGLQSLPAAAEWVLFSSADGSDRLSPDQLGPWNEAVDSGADFVIGERLTLREARDHLKATQRLGNALTCWLIWIGWGRRFRDMGSLRLCRRAALEALQLEDRAFGWNVEMQVRALELGFRIVEVPVRYFPRASGRSKISGSLKGTLRAGAGILGITARLWWRSRTRIRPPR